MKLPKTTPAEKRAANAARQARYRARQRKEAAIEAFVDRVIPDASGPIDDGDPRWQAFIAGPFFPDARLHLASLGIFTDLDGHRIDPTTGARV